MVSIPVIIADPPSVETVERSSHPGDLRCDLSNDWMEVITDDMIQRRAFDFPYLKTTVIHTTIDGKGRVARLTGS